MRIHTTICAVALTLAAASAWAKIPPPPPPDEKAKAAADEKKAKDAAAAKKTQEDIDASIDKAVKNYQSNMKKQGRPVPKPTPVAAATPPQVMPGPGAAKGAATPDKGGANPAGAASAKGHEKGAMTPAGNTPPKGTDTPKDAQKK